MHKTLSKISYKIFGNINEEKVYLFKIENKYGNYVELTNYGATLKSIVVPDKYGKKENVILGYPSIDGYKSDLCYIGSTIGPFANRISKAKFSIKKDTYTLEKNDGENNNHSGNAGLNYKIFDFKIKKDSLIFTTNCDDGEGGFPGNLKVKITYKWSIENQLTIQYFAETDSITPVNFTNHAYFNLTGGRDKIQNHNLHISSNKKLEFTIDNLPTGNILCNVNKELTLDNYIKKELHNDYYIFENKTIHTFPTCILSEDISGRILKIFTTYPGVQLYTGKYLNSKYNGFNDRPHQPFDGLCLECQYYPDSPNHSHFPSTLLAPDKIYKETIIYSFSTNQ